MKKKYELWADCGFFDLFCKKKRKKKYIFKVSYVFIYLFIFFGDWNFDGYQFARDIIFKEVKLKTWKLLE